MPRIAEHRLFVDCDDTLVIWDDSSRRVNQDKEIWVREKWELDYDLIDHVENFLDHHQNYVLVVWTGGGANYAAGWAEKAFPHRSYLVMSKDIRVPVEGDICVDDMAIECKNSGVQVFLPTVRYCYLCGPDEVEEELKEQGGESETGGQ